MPGTGGAALVAQADRAAAAAASFEATRAAYLKSAAQDAAQRRQLLQTAATRSCRRIWCRRPWRNWSRGELQTVTRAIARFADDKDRGIQQLRQSLERERVALAALSEYDPGSPEDGGGNFGSRRRAGAGPRENRRGIRRPGFAALPDCCADGEWRARPGPITMKSWPRRFKSPTRRLPAAP